MEKKCCICGKDFIEYANNSYPIKIGVCCDTCNSRFVVPGRLFMSHFPMTNFEVVKNDLEVKEFAHKLKERDFLLINSIQDDMDIYNNPETEEKVIVCKI